MGWEQIESKWAAMTLRVRGEPCIFKVDAAAAKPRRTAKSETLASNAADPLSALSTDKTATMSAQ